MSERNKGQGANLFGIDSGFGSIVAAAHELKAPVGLIRQLALTLEDAERLHLDTEAQKQLIRRIILSSERSLRLSDTLTKGARLQDTLFELEPINVVQILEEVAAELTPLFTECGSRLQIRRNHVPLALANRELVRQIAINLCDNALHYSEKGKPVALQLTSRDHGASVRIGVRDAGANGYDNGSLAKLAKKLGKSPQTLGARPQSSGLGLYIASQCAEAMNGRLGLTQHRRGATFYLDLPASRQMDLFKI